VFFESLGTLIKNVCHLSKVENRYLLAQCNNHILLQFEQIVKDA